VAQRLEIASPKTVRADRALEARTGIAPVTAPPAAPPPIPKKGGLSPAKLALIIGGAAGLLLLFLGAIGVWYFTSRKPAPPKTVTTQKSSMAPTIVLPPNSAVDRSSGMADKAKNMNPFKSTTQPQPSVAPSVPPSAPSNGPNAPHQPAAQPVVPVNDFTGG
jgi:hypothetical protein